MHARKALKAPNSPVGALFFVPLHWSSVLV
jgi:hypothetical protein